MNHIEEIVKEIEAIIKPKKIDISQICLDEVEELSSEDFDKGYKIITKYTQSHQISEIVLQFPSFKFTVYHQESKK